jgi:pimeloyl-ACP methyl ester carboxylesterase
VPDAQLVVIDGAGHMPFFERPEEFFSAVSGFLGERDGGS